MGQLHGELTAAGIAMDAPLLEADWEASQRTLNVNTTGIHWTMKLFAEHLVDTKAPGSIVAISSMNGARTLCSVQPQSAYNASNAAVKGLVGPLAGELGQYGIHVNCISPGESTSATPGGNIINQDLVSAIQSPLLARLQGVKQAMLGWYRDGAPLQRLGVPGNLAYMVCYLLSDAAAFTTGADMLVTGGLRAVSTHK